MNNKVLQLKLVSFSFSFLFHFFFSKSVEISIDNDEIGDTSLQEKINRENSLLLEEYYQQYRKWVSLEGIEVFSLFRLLPFFFFFLDSGKKGVQW